MQDRPAAKHPAKHAAKHAGRTAAKTAKPRASRTRCGSSSSGAWARSGGTAPASRWTGASSSSTAGSCSPIPTCPASTWCCPTSPTCGRTPTGSTGIVLTHGHEDHTGGLAYLLRDLRVPIYGSELTLGLARNRVDEAGLADRASYIAVADGERRRIGPCDVEFIPVTHSVPHAFAIAFHTPQGVILHSGDFKLDLHPVDGRRTDLARIGALADGPGIRLLLADSTNAEEPGFTPSESTVGPTLRRVFVERPGRRFIVACFASHIHRVQQVVDAAVASGRPGGHPRAARWRRTSSWPRGSASSSIPPGTLVDIEDIDSLPPGRSA